MLNISYKFQIYLAALLAVLIIAVGQFVTVRAYDPLDATCSDVTQGQGSDFCSNVSEDKNRTFVYGDNNIFVKIIQAIVLITGFVSVVMVVIGGAKYVLSAGDASGIKSAKDTILYALVGLVVAIFSQGIVAFVLSRFK